MSSGKEQNDGAGGRVRPQLGVQGGPVPPEAWKTKTEEAEPEAEQRTTHEQRPTKWREAASGGRTDTPKPLGSGVGRGGAQEQTRSAPPREAAQPQAPSPETHAPPARQAGGEAKSSGRSAGTQRRAASRDRPETAPARADPAPPLFAQTGGRASAGGVIEQGDLGLPEGTGAKARPAPPRTRGVIQDEDLIGSPGEAKERSEPGEPFIKADEFGLLGSGQTKEQVREQGPPAVFKPGPAGPVGKAPGHFEGGMALPGSGEISLVGRPDTLAAGGESHFKGAPGWFGPLTKAETERAQEREARKQQAAAAREQAAQESQAAVAAAAAEAPAVPRVTQGKTFGEAAEAAAPAQVYPGRGLPPSTAEQDAAGRHYPGIGKHRTHTSWKIAGDAAASEGQAPPLASAAKEYAAPSAAEVAALTPQPPATSMRSGAPELGSVKGDVAEVKAVAEARPQQAGAIARARTGTPRGLDQAAIRLETGEATTADALVAEKAGVAPPLALPARAPAEASAGGHILGPRGKKDKEDNEGKGKGKGYAKEKVRSSERPIAAWYGAFGYLMQFMIIDAVLGTNYAERFMANNNALQILTADLAEVHELSPFAYPSMQDIEEAMGYVSSFVARHYETQRQELGYDQMQLYYEVGLVPDYKKYNDARARLNERMERWAVDPAMEGALDPEVVIYFTANSAQIDKATWDSVEDEQLRKDLKTVTGPSTVYTDVRPDGQVFHYIGLYGVRPDIVLVYYNDGTSGEDMSHLIPIMDRIVKGEKTRRNMQDFRWLDEKIEDFPGGPITLREGFIMICEALAEGKIDIAIKEVKTHGNKFNDSYGPINKSLGHSPATDDTLKGSHMETDVCVTTKAFVQLAKNVGGFDDEKIKDMRRHMSADVDEIALRLLHASVKDPAHADAKGFNIPAPAYRSYTVGNEELMHGWEAQEQRMIEAGRKATEGLNSPSVTILSYNAGFNEDAEAA